MIQNLSNQNKITQDKMIELKCKNEEIIIKTRIRNKVQ